MPRSPNPPDRSVGFPLSNNCATFRVPSSTDRSRRRRRDINKKNVFSPRAFPTKKSHTGRSRARRYIIITITITIMMVTLPLPESRSRRVRLTFLSRTRPPTPRWRAGAARARRRPYDARRRKPFPSVPPSTDLARRLRRRGGAFSAM